MHHLTRDLFCCKLDEWLGLKYTFFPKIGSQIIIPQFDTVLSHMDTSSTANSSKSVTDIEGRSQTSYTTPGTGVVSHEAPIWDIQVLA